MNLSDYLRHTEKIGECLEWRRCLNSDGYPRAGIKGNTNIKVHREVFYLVNGFYPDVVRHSCDNRICINPDHLLPGTPIDNVKDRNQRARTFNYVSPEELNMVRYLRETGLRYREIAKKLHIKYKRVEYIINLARKEG
jgi:hypothetical protein